MKLHLSLLQIFLFQPLQSYDYLISLLETDCSHFHFGCISHPHGNSRQNPASLCTMFYRGACSSGVFSAIKCYSMTGLCQINNCTPRVIEIKHINDKISTVRLLLGRHKTTRASSGLDPHLESVSVCMSHRRKRCLLLDLLDSNFRVELSFLYNFLLFP